MEGETTADQGLHGRIQAHQYHSSELKDHQVIDSSTEVGKAARHTDISHRINQRDWTRMGARDCGIPANSAVHRNY